MTEGLSGIEPGLFGALGGLLTYVVSFAWPELKGRWNEFKTPGVPDPPPLSSGAIVVLVFWLVVQLFVSGVVASVFHKAHASVEAAAVTGMAANGLVAGYARSA
jgi:membrane associated rhomboid family serine protease